MQRRAELLGSEDETYHGCRGVRVTVQREDICELWCESVVRAAKRVTEEGVPLKLQILLAMVTLPQEVQSFVRVFERKLREKTVGKPDWLRGISVMIETSGVFHLVEEILSVRGHGVEVNGALFGGNDFTAACLNMNRADAAALILPAYLRLGIFPVSPFVSLNEQVVGRAIVSVLRRIRALAAGNAREYLLGLGGEIAGDWDSVEWLNDRAQPLGLGYVSTPPERVPFVLCASARSSLLALNGSAPVSACSGAHPASTLEVRFVQP